MFKCYEIQKKQINFWLKRKLGNSFAGKEQWEVFSARVNKHGQKQRAGWIKK